MKPLKTLLREWFIEPPRGKVLNLQRLLWLAVARESRVKSKAGIIYNPQHDARVQWAVQHLETLTGHRSRIDPSIEASAEFALGLTPTPTCHANSDP